MDYNKLALLCGRFTIGNCHHRGISADEQDAIHQKMPDKRDSFLSSGISDGSPLEVLAPLCYASIGPTRTR